MIGRAIVTMLAVGLSAGWAVAQMPPMGGGLPSGHPPINSGRPTSMPAGHPMIGGAGAAAVSQPDVKGSLIVRAVQGTKDGPAIGGDPVVVELYQMGQSVGKFNGKLDDRGMAVFDGLPVGSGAQAVVTVTHAAVPFRAVSPLMDAERPDQSVKLTLGETTETAPPWRTTMRHVMVVPAEQGGLLVREIVVVYNPADRVWLGTADSAGQRTTVLLSVPPDVDKLDIAESIGFDRNSVKHHAKDGQLAVLQPLPPGKSQYDFSYVVLAKDRKAQLTLVASGATDQLMVSMPTELAAQCKAPGFPEVMNAGPKHRMFGVSDLAGGTKFTLEFSNLAPDRPVPGKKSSSEDDSGPSPKTLAAAGAGLLVVCGLGYLLLKPSRNSPQRHV